MQTKTKTTNGTAPTLAAHLSSFEGALWDNRTNTILRPVFDRHFRHIESAEQLKATLRAGAYAWPGGYLLYFITDDGAALSFDTVRAEFRAVLDSVKTKSRDGWRVVACDVNWEDADLNDAHTGEKIESAYAE